MRTSHQSRFQSSATGIGHSTLPRSARKLTLGLALGACLCAGQLLAGAPAAEAAPVTGVTQAAAAPAVRVTPSFTKKTIRYGQSVLVAAHVVDGRTGKPLGNRRATVQYTVGAGWKTAKTMNTSAAGNAWLTAKPKRYTVYRILVSGGATGAVKVTVTGIPKMTKAQRVIAEAKKKVGSPYRRNAAGPRAFDCSGLTKFVYHTVGRNLPHKANSQQRYGKAISRSAARPGDLIVFRSGSYGYHAAIYAGGGYMYDAAKPGTKVAKRKIYGKNYVVRRLV